jgi:DUF1016 N-terminal domain
MSKATSPNTSRKLMEPKAVSLPAGYTDVRSSIVDLLNAARQATARNVNALMTASYWEIGRRIVDAEQRGKRRAGYGEQLIERLSLDLTQAFGRGFSARNLEQMRQFYLARPIPQTVSAELPKQLTADPTRKAQTASTQLSWSELANAFPLPWSAYVRLLSVKDDYVRHLYETEALRGGWSVRQLDRQIGSQFYERTALSKNKAAMLPKSAVAKSEDVVSSDEAVKDPYVLALVAKQSRRVSSVRSRTRGRLGEVLASSLFPVSVRDAVVIDHAKFPTPFGVRRVDNFHPETKQAIESKYVRITASSRVKNQIQKDAFLLRSGVLSEVTWVLFYGGSRKVVGCLQNNGIGVVDCWSAMTTESKKLDSDPTRIVKIRV